MKETIYSLLHKFWKERGLTILLVTHDLSIVWEHADKEIRGIDPLVEKKKTPFLSVFYRALKRTYKGLIERAKKGENDSFVKFSTMKYGEDIEDERLHETDEWINVGFLPVAGNPLNKIIINSICFL